MSSDDARGRILNAAGEVFAERGFRAATVREICRRADVNVASVNYYFGDKERLYVEAFKAAHPAGPELNLAPDWPNDARPEEQLRAFIHALLTRLMSAENPAWKMRLLQREILEPTPLCMEVMRAFFRAKFAQLMDILDEILPADMPAERRHQIGFSVIGQCVYFRAASPVIRMVIGEEEQREHHTVDLLTDHVCGLVLAALGLARPLGQPPSEGRSMHPRIVKSLEPEGAEK
ncbi:MAG TPA: CerR family C-terminal domain-containing protein [Thermoguttaceae bacterium]|nr:CerR family C-terminal domain-containing protein [Thermoguttaceae bacterium]